MEQNATNVDKQRVKNINRKAMYIALGLGIPYIIHLYLAYGSWGFVTNIFKGDVITLIIFAFIGLMGIIVYATFMAFRKHL